MDRHSTQLGWWCIGGEDGKIVQIYTTEEECHKCDGGISINNLCLLYWSSQRVKRGCWLAFLVPQDFPGNFLYYINPGSAEERGDYTINFRASSCYQPHSYTHCRKPCLPCTLDKSIADKELSPESSFMRHYHIYILDSMVWPEKVMMEHCRIKSEQIIWFMLVIYDYWTFKHEMDI